MIVSKLEQKTLDISDMLVRMQERGAKKQNEEAKKRDQS